jgi:hypothetical protein
MKKNPCIFRMFLLALLIASVGCQAVAEVTPTPTSTFEPPTPTPTPIFQTIDGIPLGANLNCPDRSAFGYIEENVPFNGAYVESPILIRWEYWASGGTPTDWSTVCVPTSFTLNYSAGPDFNIVNSILVINPTVKNNVNYLMFSFHLSEPLPVHTFYRWIVTGRADGIEIDQEQLPLFQQDAAWKIFFNNNPEMVGQFQTGPMCTALTISPANLISPLNGAILESDTPVFKWEMPDCAAQAFSLAFDTDPQMTSPDFGWVTKGGNFLMFAGSLQPCTQYYWQVKAGLYSYEYHLDQGDWASASEIRSFSVRSVACPDGAVEPTLTPSPNYFIPNTNANCRSGPDLSFPVVQVTLKGQSYFLDGQNLAHTWFRIMWNSSLGCWLPATAGAPNVDTSGLRILADVPTLVPTFTPTAVVSCGSFTDQPACSAQPACQWVQNLAFPTLKVFHCVSK